MNLSAYRSGSTSAPSLQPNLREAVRAPRRRPTGEPPPLPYHLQTSGVGWLITAGLLIVLSIVVFRGGCGAPRSRSRSPMTRSSGGWPGASCRGLSG